MSDAQGSGVQRSSRMRETSRAVAARTVCLLAVAASMPALSSCAVPSAGSDARVPETIAVYVPPVGPHGRGSILILPVNRPVPKAPRKTEPAPAKEPGS